ncbi:MAG: DUF2330 domain-containing protein [Candidatus Kerfeldbacteria bacterium]
MKTIRKKIIVGLMSLLIILPQISLADGMMMPPQNYWIQETGQKAVIMYEDGIETMVVSTSFEGDANDFAWVIPVPNKPEVSKGSQALFTNLDGLTGNIVSNSKDISFGLKATQDAVYEGVTIVEEKQIDYYDVTVLSSTDKDSLVTWLNDNEYNFPTSASYILNSYIDNGWYFVAMKVNSESLEWTDVSKSLRKGEATPVVLQFEAKNIVYPMKISSIVSNSKSDSEEATYVTGKHGQALKVYTADVAASYNDKLSFDITDQFNTEAGSLSMWFKPHFEYSFASHMEAMTIYDNNIPIFSFGLKFENGEHHLVLTSVDESENNYKWVTEDIAIPYNIDVWRHLALTWENGKLPKIFFGGTELIISKAYINNSQSTNINSVPFSMKMLKGTEEMRIGESGNYIYLDEFKLFNKARSNESISNEYSYSQSYSQPIIDEEGSGLTILGHFDGTLKNDVSGNNFSFKAGSTTLDNNYESVPILLYVLADNKKTLPNFSTNYANWIDKESIEKLAIDDQGDSLLKPTEKKYFLTKLTRSMTYDQMTEDLFIRDAENNETSGIEITLTGTNSVNTFYLAVGAGILLSLILAIAIFVISRKVD